MAFGDGKRFIAKEYETCQLIYFKNINIILGCL